MASIEAAKTHYNVLGDGAPVVLVHALGVSSGMWAVQVPVLAQRYRVIRYDVQGHGLTPFTGGTLTLNTLADDLIALMDRLHIEKAAIIGLSLGGLIAQALAASSPDRVAAIALISSVPTFPEAGKEGLLGRAATAEKGGMAPLVEPAIERWFTEDFVARAATDRNGENRDTQNTDGATDYPRDVLSSVRQMMLAADPAGYAAVCRALAQADMTQRLPDIKCPALILSGDRDPGVSSESQQILAAGIKSSNSMVVQNASHMVALECPGEFNSHLVNFLAWCNYN